MKRLAIALIFLPICFSKLFSQPAPVKIGVDASKVVGDMRPFWTYFGYDEPNYTTRKNGQKLLSELSRLSPHTGYVRVHNLLTSKGNSPGPDLKWGFTDAYKEDKKGKPFYNWVVVDSIVDTFIQHGMKPLMEIGFMPKDLSSKPVPYEHHWNNGGDLWTGWTYPPKDYTKWRELVYQWVKHSIDRYGEAEVKTWLWEVWNEPDIQYWSGTFDDYCKLYDFAADGLKRACAECRIGGPHTTSPRNEKARTYLTDFIAHCLHGKNYATGNTGSPLAYIGFHAKGAPEFLNGNIRMNMGAQLKDIQKAFEVVNAFPELKGIPVIIGECDPEGCAACSAARDPKYGYRNGTMYSSYTASSFARIYDLIDQYNVNLQGAVSWSFEFENQPWFAGFRDLATNGVDKPVLNVFRMFGMMEGKRIQVRSNANVTTTDIIEGNVRSQNDLNAIASATKNTLSVMVWNYCDDNIPAPSSAVEVTFDHLPTTKVLVHHYRVDSSFSNSFEKWKALGSPQQPTREQYDELEAAGQLQLYTSPQWKMVSDQRLLLDFVLPRQGVSFITLTWSD